MRRGGTQGDRPGWAKAPPIVEAEIRAVWQEDELPDEITQAPGHHPFTLGLESQEWVDSMAEVVDGGNGVYGRPKPVIAPHHRDLTTPPPVTPWSSAAPPPSFPPLDYRSPASPTVPPIPYRPPPPKPRVLMPDIDDAPPPPLPQPRVLMPEVDEASPPKSRVHMPDVDNAPSPPKPHPLMPEIDAAPASPGPRRSMPDIEDAPARRRTLPRRIVMPEVGEEQLSPGPKPPSMPEIG